MRECEFALKSGEATVERVRLGFYPTHNRQKNFGDATIRSRARALVDILQVAVQWPDERKTVWVQLKIVHLEYAE